MPLACWPLASKLVTVNDWLPMKIISTDSAFTKFQVLEERSEMHCSLFAWNAAVGMYVAAHGCLIWNKMGLWRRRGAILGKGNCPWCLVVHGGRQVWGQRKRWGHKAKCNITEKTVKQKQSERAQGKLAKGGNPNPDRAPDPRGDISKDTFIGCLSPKWGHFSLQKKEEAACSPSPLQCERPGSFILSSLRIPLYDYQNIITHCWPQNPCKITSALRSPAMKEVSDAVKSLQPIQERGRFKRLQLRLLLRNRLIHAAQTVTVIPAY